ncbi:MAG: hypothetical protein GY722_26385 [bacterium]|nr:hypothetical protein [bacterium]
MSLEALFGLIYGVWALVTVWSFAQLKAFLAKTPNITDTLSLERFKDLARVLGVSLLLRRFEVKARSLQADSEILRSEYRRVAESWVKKVEPQSVSSCSISRA